MERTAGVDGGGGLFPLNGGSACFCSLCLIDVVECDRTSISRSRFLMFFCTPCNWCANLYCVAGFFEREIAVLKLFHDATRGRRGGRGGGGSYLDRTSLWLIPLS